jgi:hypothetical protein
MISDADLFSMKMMTTGLPAASAGGVITPSGADGTERFPDPSDASTAYVYEVDGETVVSLKLVVVTVAMGTEGAAESDRYTV